MTYRWILFDADGTLFDYDAAEEQALARTLTEFGLPLSPGVHATYRQINTQLWRDFEQGKTTADRLKTTRFAQLFDALALRSPDVRAPEPERFSDRYLHNLGTCTDLMPDAEAVLRALHGKIHLALITNGLTTVQRSRLAKSGLDTYFEVVVISDEEGVAKPDPGIFDVAMARMGSPLKEEVLVVGDSLTSDMRGASQYELDACWYNPKGLPRDTDFEIRYEIQSLREIPRLLGVERA
ncbi:MAG: YjjG family noncanonical pyrimidine nucleotidase [Anaerolineae bacterium]